jgi:hypothetical protein
MRISAILQKKSIAILVIMGIVIASILYISTERLPPYLPNENFAFMKNDVNSSFWNITCIDVGIKLKNNSISDLYLKVEDRKGCVSFPSTSIGNLKNVFIHGIAFFEIALLNGSTEDCVDTGDYFLMDKSIYPNSFRFIITDRLGETLFFDEVF